MNGVLLNIFVNAVIARVSSGEGTVEDVVASYTRLSESDKQQIIDVVRAKLLSV